ncbi:hypothetical protein W97_03510 [Coniosporium apollinis CBS 100218]|uniref:Serine hydrolase domain-containing protein n=1 Tax=Coniosporium apollinis (strain CBS 100218) TaxID=1168221 RepID=R7YR46_CONA1|nr:uncharacterized protein W97_03510 [Coniosporium apollinis CBS 100218]EON64279.1 hypothetical protein W97_03510 [Coniosporium apollinis CBS 100218]
MAPQPNGTTPDPTLHSPRLLCLHGGGVTGDIFRAQSRALISRLSPTFRLVFADGPFFCDPGPGIVPVYADWGPYRRWLRWLPTHAEVDAETAIEEVFYNIRTAMDEDTARGASGEWVGVMGFSQGAKMAASLLYEQQVREEKLGSEIPGPLGEGVRLRFAVCMAGRAPLVALSEEAMGEDMVDASQISEGFQFGEGGSRSVLRLPSLHVHGLKDAGLHLHRRLLEQYCEKGSTTLVEWDGDHRIPLKSKDADLVTNAIFDIARKTGVLE